MLPEHPLLRPLPPLIGLTGRARSGKDSTFQIASQLRPGKLARVAFADALKEAVALAAGVDVPTIEAQKPLFRATLQEFGVLMRQLHGPDYWVRKVARPIDSLRAAGKAVMVCDIRFENEAEFVRSKGGILVRVVRPHLGPTTREHISETEQDRIPVDVTLEAATLHELQPQVESLLTSLKL